MAEHKLLGIIVAVGLVIVGGIFMVIEWNSATPDGPEGATVSVVTPDEAEAPAQQQAPEPTLSPTPLSGKIVVSKRPVEVLASPSASASAMFGFPAGRPFRVLGGDGNYVKIQDLKSGASGWIEEAALAPAPPPVPAASTRRGGTSPKPSGSPTRRRAASPDTSTAAAEPKPKRQRAKPFGGLFGGLFGGR